MVKGYCLSERKKNVEMTNVKYEFNSIGRAVACGKCSSCGGKMCKILSKEEVNKAPEEFRKQVEKKKK